MKIISENIHNLAELATSEGGKPITDSIIEIKRGAEGVESCIRGLKIRLWFSYTNEYK